jgi:DNA-binding IscR family transcriptional regulator
MTLSLTELTPYDQEFIDEYIAKRKKMQERRFSTRILRALAENGNHVRSLNELMQYFGYRPKTALLKKNLYMLEERGLIKITIGKYGAWEITRRTGKR